VEKKVGRDKQKTELPCSTAVANYTHNIGKVSLYDKLSAYYGVSRSSNKLWKFSTSTKCVHCEQFYYVLYHKWNITHCIWEQVTEFLNELTAATDHNLHISEVTNRKRCLSIDIPSLKLLNTENITIEKCVHYH
jgi:hypothetical protein